MISEGSCDSEDWRNDADSFNITEINNILKYVTLDYKTSFKSLGYICSNSQKYTV